MSKSLGNFTNLLDLIESTDPRAYRLLVLQAHYRSPIEVNEGHHRRRGRRARAARRARPALAEPTCRRSPPDADALDEVPAGHGRRPRHARRRRPAVRRWCAGPTPALDDERPRRAPAPLGGRGPRDLRGAVGLELERRRRRASPPTVARRRRVSATRPGAAKDWAPADALRDRARSRRLGRARTPPTGTHGPSAPDEPAGRSRRVACAGRAPERQLPRGLRHHLDDGRHRPRRLRHRRCRSSRSTPSASAPRRPSSACWSASFSLAQLVFAPLWGRLSDRIGRKPVLLISLFGTALGSLLTGVAGVDRGLPASSAASSTARRARACRWPRPSVADVAPPDAAGPADGPARRGLRRRLRGRPGHRRAGRARRARRCRSSSPRPSPRSTASSPSSACPRRARASPAPARRRPRSRRPGRGVRRLRGRRRGRRRAALAHARPRRRHRRRAHRGRAGARRPGIVRAAPTWPARSGGDAGRRAGHRPADRRGVRRRWSRSAGSRPRSRCSTESPLRARPSARPSAVFTAIGIALVAVQGGVVRPGQRAGSASRTRCASALVANAVGPRRCSPSTPAGSALVAGAAAARASARACSRPTLSSAVAGRAGRRRGRSGSAGSSRPAAWPGCSARSSAGVAVRARRRRRPLRPRRRARARGAGAGRRVGVAPTRPRRRRRSRPDRDAGRRSRGPRRRPRSPAWVARRGPARSTLSAR